MDINYATINRSNTGQRRPKTGGDWKLYPMVSRIAGSVHRGTDPRNRFQSRGNHGHPHQSHMVRFSGRQQFNSQPRQFVQQNRLNFHSPRNENNQRQGGQLIIESMVCSKHFYTLIDTGSNMCL
ncbi:hypothetical protein TNCV_3893451 [Trichonephila clavipes]|nr:hypothetical protein TNCV_3893451 [Trichonephila clavipes]